MHKDRVIEALQRPAAELGLSSAWQRLRPQFDIHLYPQLISTNAEAWRLVEQGYGAGTVVIAQEQSAGRGQWGRRWASAPGGLYLSLVLEPELALAEVTLLTLASAWGIVSSLENLGIPIQIKWPNDLVHQGKKVGGILTESRSRASTLPQTVSANVFAPYVVIGIGVNWDNPLPENACSLRQLLPESGGTRLKTLEDLAAIVICGVLQGYFTYRYQPGKPFSDLYQNKLSHLGQRMTIRGNTAIVKGVTPVGELLIEILHGDGRKTIQSLRPGEISLGYNS
jgi:BirA family biotin operon repressor/biotin-[acetyl-CoA-carboxylase] ligase